MEPIHEKPMLPQEIAINMIKAANEKAKELNIKVSVAVCDDGGNLKAFARMDGASLLSVEISQNKAYTASASGRPTADWYPLMEKDPALLHGIVHTNRLTIFGGGLPIYIKQKLVGGIGVSGGTVKQDVCCAENAIAALENMLRAAEESVCES